MSVSGVARVGVIRGGNRKFQATILDDLLSLSLEKVSAKHLNEIFSVSHKKAEYTPQGIF